MKNLDEFKASLKDHQMPGGLSVYLQSLWHDGKGNWKAAHDLIDQLGGKRAAHLHAYLHRKEGDIWNADYWYNRAGQKRPGITLDEEWEQLVFTFLSAS